MSVMMMPMVVMAMVTMPSARRCQWNRSEQHKCHAYQFHFSHSGLHTQVVLVLITEGRRSVSPSLLDISWRCGGNDNRSIPITRCVASGWIAILGWVGGCSITQIAQAITQQSHPYRESISAMTPSMVVMLAVAVMMAVLAVVIVTVAMPSSRPG